MNNRYHITAAGQVNRIERMRMAEIDTLLGGKGVDCVNLHLAIEIPGPDGELLHIDRGSVMIVNDTSMLDGLPVNTLATALYRTRAPDSPYSMHGDVVIVPDEDFA